MLAPQAGTVDTGPRMKRHGQSRSPKPKPAATVPQTEVKTHDREVAGHHWSGGQGIMLHAMVFLSGFACLIYQILWMRQFGLFFGNTSHAAALTLAAFFAGLAAGAWFWGRRSALFAKPLKTYAWLELGIAIGGVAVMVAPGLSHSLFPLLYGQDGPGIALLSFKILWTLVMVFPPAFLMGGTIPVLGQCLIGRQAEFGATAARIYAVNTIGAACGAFAAAFLLIGSLGFRLTCVVAIVVSSVAALLAFKLSRNAAMNPPRHAAPEKNIAQRGASLSRGWIGILAFLSGFNILALEVLWTRMLAQVHENSVYSFSSVLIIVLACLAMGAWLASKLAAGKLPGTQSLLLLTSIGGAALCVSPFIFVRLTDNLSMLPTEASFASYVFKLFATGFLAIGPACLLLGAVFPLLMKSEEPFATQAGYSIGRLSSINTVGAILGSLVCGFLLLQWLGMWRTMQVIAVSYLLAALFTPGNRSPIIRAAKVLVFVVIVMALTLLNPARLPTTASTDSVGQAETVVEKWEASDCTVTVVRKHGDNLAIKINSNYGLGSTDAYAPQIFQARIPLLAFPATDSVFFLGMGTGITAGEALDDNDFKYISKVVVAELSPSVVAASKKYFAGGTGGPDMTNGLFQDPRARVLVEDGRNHLMGTRETYAMINADLFLPYGRGTGDLYSREHFQNVKSRLKPGGVFVQWLPLYQVSETEFGIIARTMLSVFPQVSLWRGNFQPGAEMVALVGHQNKDPLPASTLDVELAKQEAVEGATHLDMQELMLPINSQTILMFYGGNLTLAADLFANHPLNTDDRPVIEFGTPRSLHRSEEQGKAQFVASRFADLVDRIQSRTPPAVDPLLANRSPSSRELPLAGSAFHRGWIARATGDEERWMENWKRFLKHWSRTDAGE
jgi:spermidine synthase